MTWFFGEYIARLLAQKGGKKAGWHMKRLADDTGLGYSHVHWIVTGKATGKSGPPSITLDTLLQLSEALNVSETKLIMAYKGKDPDKAVSRDLSDNELEDIMQEALKIAIEKKRRGDV